jgi:hypothetical protein
MLVDFKESVMSEPLLDLDDASSELLLDLDDDTELDGAASVLLLDLDEVVDPLAAFGLISLYAFPLRFLISALTACSSESIDIEADMLMDSEYK